MRALRTLLRSPWLLAAAVLPLGAGLGACVAAFAALDALYLAPLPFHRPERLVEVWSSVDPRSTQRIDLLATERAASLVASRPRSLAGTAAYAPAAAELEHGDARKRVVAAAVTPGFFRTLGIRPLLGRTLDGAQSGEAAVLLGEALWRSAFAADREVLGRVVRLWNAPFTVVGVLPQRSGHPRDADLWLPWSSLPAARSPVAAVVVGRLRDDVAFAALQNELAARAHAELESEATRYGGMGLAAAAFTETVRGSESRVVPLAAAVIAVLYLIVLLELSHVVIVRVLARSHDSAVRAALGAGRWHLLRPLLAETILLGGLALLPGFVLAAWCVLLLPRLDPVLAAAALDARVVAFAVVLALLTAVLLALAPVSLLRSDALVMLHRRAASSATTAAERVARGGLVAVQLALALALLGTCSVLVRAVREIRVLDVGYDADRLVLVRPDWRRDDTADVLQRVQVEALRDRLRSRFGAGVTLWRTRVGPWPPLPPERQLTIEGQSEPPSRQQELWNYDEVDPTFFRTIGLPVVDGRGFDDRDLAGALPVAIITASAARAWWPGQSALGRRIRLGDASSGEPWLTLVGVTEDVETITSFARYFAAVRRPSRRVFRPLAQSPDQPPPQWAARQCFYCSLMTLGVRAGSDARVLAEQLRRELPALAPDLPEADVLTALEEQMNAHETAHFARASRLIGTFGAVALMVALIGVSAIVTDAVTRRTHELGIRLALGARSRHVLATVSRDSVLACALGTAAGTALLFVAEPFARRWIYLGGHPWLLPGTSPTDLRVIAPIALALLLVSAGAAFVAAHRVTRLDPVVALREE